MNKVFLIDGSDFSDYVDRYGYTAEQEPVYGSSVTTLDGVDHVSITRWKSYLTVTIKPIGRADARALYEAIARPSVSVTYYSPQLGQVTQSMRVKSIPLSLSLAMTDEDYYANTKLQFIQN